jgi:putative tryptophan/tyrosine transport system substrate-binding protein
LFSKRLQLLNEMVPKPTALAVLLNPNNPNAEPDSRETQAAAVALGRDLLVLKASDERGIEEAFATVVERRVGGLIVGVSGFFFDRRDQIFALSRTPHAKSRQVAARLYSSALRIRVRRLSSTGPEGP